MPLQLPLQESALTLPNSVTDMKSVHEATLRTWYGEPSQLPPIQGNHRVPQEK
jgi:hypothetical protein